MKRRPASLGKLGLNAEEIVRHGWDGAWGSWQNGFNKISQVIVIGHNWTILDSKNRCVMLGEIQCAFPFLESNIL